MLNLEPNAPHVMHEAGNGIFAHIPKSFSDEKMLIWINTARPLGDSVWKFAPITPENKTNRVECASGNDSWHVAFTVDGHPFDQRDGHAHVSDVGVEGGMGQIDPEALAGVDRMVELLREMSDHLPRPSKPIIAVAGVGAPSLLTFKPNVATKLKEFMHELMRGPGPLTFAEREGIAASVSMANHAFWCAAAHRSAAINLVGSRDRLRDLLASNKFAGLGAFTIAVNAGVQVPPSIIERIKGDGWTDEALHDAALITGAFRMMNAYVEGLAAVTPPLNSPIYDQVGKRLAERGYV